MDPRAVQPLVQAFFQGWENWHPDVDSAVLQALKQLNGQAELVEPLLTRLKQAGWMLGYIVQLLGEIGDSRAVQPLARQLKSADERTRPILQEALRKLGYSSDM